MAIELRVAVEVVNTEPDMPGNPGIIIRSQQISTLIWHDDLGIAAAFALANSRLGGLIEGVTVDARGQLELAERESRDVK